MWGTLLEKAFSKYHGNYLHTVGGNPLMAVRTLHGGPWEDLAHDSEWGVAEADMWDILKRHDTNHEIIQAATSGSNHNN